MSCRWRSAYSFRPVEEPAGVILFQVDANNSARMWVVAQDHEFVKAERGSYKNVLKLLAVWVPLTACLLFFGCRSAPVSGPEAGLIDS
ncbi:MAG: hypothetical protein R3C11_13585 [Planctomycetaceae bacterium]